MVYLARMNLFAVHVLGALLSSASTSVQYASAQDDSLRVRIERRIAEVPGASVGVAFRDLARADTLYLRADERFHAASTMKVPVMIELFRRAERGQISLSQRIPLKNEFASIVDGTPYSLDAK